MSTYPYTYLEPRWPRNPHEHDDGPPSDEEMGLDDYRAEVDALLPEGHRPVSADVARPHCLGGDPPAECAEDWHNYCQETP